MKESTRDKIVSFFTILSFGALASVLLYGIITDSDRKRKANENVATINETFTKTLEKGRVICINTDAYLSFKGENYSVNIPLFDEYGNRFQCSQSK